MICLKITFLKKKTIFSVFIYHRLVLFFSFLRRGLTPPHRVKSISMATFTTDEIELLRTRGNEYCKRVWLGLYDGTTPHTDPRAEEHTIRDFMVDKYERKRYYIDPLNVTLTNGQQHVENNNKNTNVNVVLNPPQQKQKKVEKLVDFVADFSSADIFSAVNNNSNGNSSESSSVSFANFDNNPVFNSTSKYCCFRCVCNY